MKIRIKNTIKKIVQELKKEKFVEGIILFGSYAKGKETPLSDIDLCVIDNPKFPEKERKKAYLYGNDKVQISLFSELPLYIKFEVLKYGKVLFARNPCMLKEIKEKTVSDYLEHKWLWEQYFKIRKESGEWYIRPK